MRELDCCSNDKIYREVFEKIILFVDNLWTLMILLILISLIFMYAR